MFRSSISFRLGFYFGLWFISSSSINSSLDATRTVRVAVNRRIATAGSLSARRWLFVSADGIIGMRRVLRPLNRNILQSSLVQCLQSHPNFCSRIYRAVTNDNILLVVEILHGREVAQEAVNILCGQETTVHIPADIEGASFDGSHAVVQMAVEVV